MTSRAAHAKRRAPTPKVFRLSNFSQDAKGASNDPVLTPAQVAGFQRAAPRQKRWNVGGAVGTHQGATSRREN